MILICFVGRYLISMEEQVISRAHRMGATRPVHVETLAMRGTIEEQMLKFLQVNLSIGPAWLVELKIVYWEDAFQLNRLLDL